MEYLRYQIAREIGVTHDWPVVIVGIGNLGHALANYSGFRSRGFRVVALLDADGCRHGEEVADLEVRPFDELERIVAGLGLTRYGAVGDEFDHNIHDALSHIGEDPEVSVTTCKVVAKAGYKIGDRVVRAAQVLVVDPVEG